MLAVDKLVPYAKNARTHSDAQVAQIAGSISEFGFVNPILLGDDNVIIAGHGRFKRINTKPVTPPKPTIIEDWSNVIKICGSASASSVVFKYKIVWKFYQNSRSFRYVVKGAK
jgi:hypothetical protein